jgi:hypothetical protein
MATALGAALGPGMAIVLDQVNEFEFGLPFLQTQYFNGMTGPGFFMSLNWLIYMICIVFFFGEPTRSGLDELKKREETDSKKKSLLSEIEMASMKGSDADESGFDQDLISLDDDEEDEVRVDVSGIAEKIGKECSYTSSAPVLQI